MEAVLRFLFIIIIIYYSFKVLGRWVFPYLIKRWIGKVQKNFYNQNPHLDPDAYKKQEGEVEIKYNSSNKSSKEEIGDYVDYEEIKEEKNK